MFDFVVKIMGSGIASLIYFLSMTFTVADDGLIMKTHLKDPVTEEILSVTKQEYSFKIEYYSSLIVNDKKVYKETMFHNLVYNDGWFINNEPVPADSIQQKMGQLKMLFEGYTPAEGDEILAFVKATIVPDELFKKSTGFNTKILWENYVPRKKSSFRFKNGTFEEL